VSCLPSIVRDIYSYAHIRAENALRLDFTYLRHSSRCRTLPRNVDLLPLWRIHDLTSIECTFESPQSCQLLVCLFSESCPRIHDMRASNRTSGFSSIFDEQWYDQLKRRHCWENACFLVTCEERSKRTVDLLHEYTHPQGHLQAQLDLMSPFCVLFHCRDFVRTPAPMNFSLMLIVF
jgi:hypothetical protein